MGPLLSSRVVATVAASTHGGNLIAAWVLGWVTSFSYLAVLLLLWACGLGLPLSEDLIVLAGGTLVAKANLSLPLMMVTAYVGKLGGDLMIFRIGRKLGPKTFTHPRFRRILTPERVAWAQQHFVRHGILTVFMARFLPGLRAPSYLVAGACGFSSKKFLLADGIAAGLSAPLLTYLGYRFGMTVLERIHGTLRWVVLGVVAAAVVTWGIRWFVARRRAAREPAPPLPPPVHLEEARASSEYPVR